MPGDVVVGRILGVFGLRGEIKLSVADPDILRPGLPLTLEFERGGQTTTVLEAIRPHKQGFVARLRGVGDVDAARGLQGAVISVGRDTLPPLTEHAYRQADLVGMRVVDARRGPLGDVIDVRRYPSCDMLVLDENDLLVPVLHAYGFDVDLAERVIRVTLPDGFEELG